MQEEKEIVTDIDTALHGDAEERYYFPCDGKCRICPFPGVNCRKAETQDAKGESTL